jgi:beta-lactamase regulating signal transducer with metallopeptidase domain
MEPFITLLESERCTNLLLALAHTLWQGALAAGVLFLYLRQAPAEAAGKRHAAGIAALGAIVLAALLTWSILGYEPAVAQDGVAPTQVAADALQAPEPTASKTASPAREIRTIPQAPRSRQIWIMGAWLGGVGVMFLRMVAVVVGGSRLRGQCRPLENVETLALIEQLRAGMGIGRRIRVLIGERISTPGVIGCFWPTLLLPASMLSGIPADDLRAILIHELAHIRRYDYLVNFLQMVVEALLFFNPAVWWISRQIRIEREACCDAAGVQWIGQRDKYAEALVAWAHRLGTAAPAVGFSEGTDRGTLLDRVRRILVAGHQPRPRVPWHIATAMLVLSLACLVLIGQATGLAVNLAGKILSPQERIDKIADISKQYGRDNREYSPQDKVQFSGIVRTYDGKPVPSRVHLSFRSNRASHGTSMAAGMAKDGNFNQSIDYGTTYITATGEGYSPAFAGPFDAEPGGRIEGIELVLGEGFPGRILIVDETGKPVRDAELTGGYTYPSSDSLFHTIQLATDANGVATLEHAAAERITLQIQADEFEPQQIQELVLDPNEAKTVVLKRAQPVTGVVLAEATGQPIEGAEIRIAASVRGGHPFVQDRTSSPADAVTDREGRFELKCLRQDLRYLLFVRASGYAYRYIRDIETTNRDLRIVLGPAKIIRGRVTGDLSLLPTDPESGEPVIYVENAYRYPESSGYADGSKKTPVTIRDGIGHFEINDFWGQTVTLSAGMERIRMDVEQDRLDDVVIDLQPSARRQVVLWFQVPQGAPPITGAVRIDYISERARQQKQSMTPGWIDIVDNRASCEIPAPSQFKYNIDFRQGKRPVGYWFNEIHPIDIGVGEGPFMIEVPVHPAGAIYGRILTPDGNAAQNAQATLMIAKKPAIEGGQAVSLSGLFGALDGGVDRGTFSVTPLPLGGQYAIVAYEDYTFAMSDAFSLDEKSPIVNVDLTLPRGVDVEGRLLDPNGVPAHSEVALEVSIKNGEHSWGRSGVQVQPDEAGRFAFKNVNPGPAGTCFIRVIGGKGYRPVRRDVRGLRSPVVIQLEKGRRATGVVIDDATGWPVPGVEVYAQSADGPQGGYRRDAELLEADGRTDTQGRFTFSNMAADYYRLNTRGANLADPMRALVVKGGHEEPVTIRVKIPEWSDLKPRSP